MFSISVIVLGISPNFVKRSAYGKKGETDWDSSQVEKIFQCMSSYLLLVILNTPCEEGDVDEDGG